ncbi:preprotein translocase subunit SecY [Candidatus Nomurabacteria bacterium]|nr:preprotein translocase subunit SecY [Candidatus Saccharibacteria bacterium]MCB9821755.1 preprotein translocase subunit SecY [Candidatus Nomurabacteria bacterium]
MGWKTIFRSLKNKDMQKRMVIVLLLIVVFRMISHIPVPLAEPTQLKQLINNLFSSQQLLGFFDLLSGGALSSLSIMLMGLGPYINASIIMQLLTKAFPKLEELQQDGESGRRKINQWTRIISIPLALIQSVGLIFLIRQQASGQLGIDITANTSIFQWALMIAALTGGSVLLMWLGELITEQGIGNGISLLIFAGIVSALPKTAATLVNTIEGSKEQLNVFNWFTLPVSGKGLAVVGGILLATLFVTYLVVKLNEAQRIIKVSYAKRVRGNKAYGGVGTILPIKLITAGVIPIIFAVAFLSVPQFVGQLIQNNQTPWIADLGRNLTIWFAQPGQQQAVANNPVNTYIYPVVYFLLVFIFTYFYTGVVFNAKEIAENLQKQGGFIEKIRPGEQTEKYLSKTVNRLNLFGATSLGMLALLPLIVERLLGTSSLTIGGTGLLIVVSVALETLRQLESRALMVTYDQDY